MMLSKRRSGRHGRSFGKLARIAVAGGAAAVALGTIGVTGASAGHSTLNATVGCQEESWSLNFDGSFFAAPFVNLVRIRLLDGPAEALAEVPAAGYLGVPCRTRTRTRPTSTTPCWARSTSV